MHFTEKDKERLELSISGLKSFIEHKVQELSVVNLLLVKLLIRDFNMSFIFHDRNDDDYFIGEPWMTKGADRETLCDVFCPICHSSWHKWIEFYEPNKTALVWCNSCRKIVDALCKAVPYVY